MNKTKDMRIFILLTGLLTIVIFNTCNGLNKKFTYSDVYGRGYLKILGKIPSIVDWYDENSYLMWKPDDQNSNTILQKIDARTGTASMLVDFSPVNKRFQTGKLLNPWTAHTNDYTGFIINYLDDLYYFSNHDSNIVQLTSSAGIEKNPTFSQDGQKIAFTRDNDLYVIDIKSRKEKRLTYSGTELVYNGYASWVYYEEILGRRSKYKAFWWSPDSKKLSFLRFDDNPVPEFPIVHCEGVHSYLEIQRYPKPGDPNPIVKLGVVNVENGDLDWLDSTEQNDDYIAWPFWTIDSNELLYQKVNRGQDNVQIVKANMRSGSKNIIFNEQQPSWINFFSDLYILKNGEGFLVRSDKSGWRHLYLYNIDGILICKITGDELHVDKIEKVDVKNRVIFFSGFQDKSVETHLFKVNFDGTNLKKLTNTEGTHSVKVAPSGTYYIDTYSHIHQPQKVELFDNTGNLIRSLGDRNSPELERYDLGNTELFTIPTEDGQELPALWILPPNIDKSKKYPVVIQVYGGPGRANVKNKFRSLTDHYLAQNNIIFFTVDHRGSYHYGKKGTSLMHRNLGKWEMHDYIEAAKWLRNLPFVDENRIGIIGASYGGYVVAMAMTYGAEYFTHGVALYSVTDWRLYDNFYTERFMDTPEENPEGYTFGAASTHAENYKGKMLIVHGALDDNVHLQNTTQLVQLLQRLNKSFELMIYPNQKHGTRGAWRRHSNRETINFWFRHFFGRELVID